MVEMGKLPRLVEEAKEALANASPCADPDIEYYRGPSCDVIMLHAALNSLVEELKNYRYCNVCMSIIRNKP